VSGTSSPSVLVARLVSVNPGQPCGQQEILEELRRVILAGEAAPGTFIPLDAVAQFFAVSVIPVRESLKTLIGEGLVDHVPRGGYRVAQLTRDELREFYVIREVLEAAALRSAVARANPPTTLSPWRSTGRSPPNWPLTTTGRTTGTAGGSTWLSSHRRVCIAFSTCSSWRGTSPTRHNPWPRCPPPSGSACMGTTPPCWRPSSRATRTSWCGVPGSTTSGSSEPSTSPETPPPSHAWSGHISRIYAHRPSQPIPFGWMLVGTGPKTAAGLASGHIFGGATRLSPIDERECPP